MPTPIPLSFCDLATRDDALSQNGDPLVLLAAYVPWEDFRPALKGGRPPFDAVLMFKILVLKALYNLSDDQTAYQIRDRLSFMRFLQLDLGHRIPNAKTIWLFRETLAQAQVVETLFEQFETYLSAHGLHPRGGHLIDASLVPVPKQRQAHDENATIKGGVCPTAWESQPAKRRQKDTEARWTVKHRDNHYGYKNHVKVDKRHKLMRQSMTVRSSMTYCCRPRRDEIFGPTRPIAPRQSKRSSRSGTCERRFTNKGIAVSL